MTPATDTTWQEQAIKAKMEMWKKIRTWLIILSLALNGALGYFFLKIAVYDIGFRTGAATLKQEAQKEFASTNQLNFHTGSRQIILVEKK